MMVIAETIIRIYRENSASFIDTLYGQTAEFLMFKQVVQLVTAVLWSFDDDHGADDFELAEGPAEWLS
jgi:hypothetical protein